IPALPALCSYVKHMSICSHVGLPAFERRLVEETGQDVPGHAADGGFLAGVAQRPAPGDGANREHRAAGGRLEEYDVGPDQLAGRAALLGVRRGHVLDRALVRVAELAGGRSEEHTSELQS